MSDRSKRKTRAQLTRLAGRALARGEQLYVAVASKSNQHTQVQLRDPNGRIVFGLSTLSPALRESCKSLKKTQAAFELGKAFAEHIKTLGVDKHTIAFDRSGSLYMGRIEALAQGIREGNIEF